MIDLIYLTRNRLEFTRKSLETLLVNTKWTLIRNMWIYDDGSTDGTLEFVEGVTLPVSGGVVRTECDSPVAIMNEFLTTKSPAPMFAKIDNDTMVPPGWLETCIGLMDGTDLLGIESMHETGPGHRRAIPAQYIGGIGLMRTAAFRHSIPEPQGRFGFTAWQDRSPDVRKAWISPSLPVCLLDRVPFDPWKSLSADYVSKGWQRPWELYENSKSALWEWWA
jgi:hypothetical protein